MENHIVSSEESPTTFNQKTDKKIARKILIVISVILFVLAIAFFSYYLGSRSENTEQGITEISQNDNPFPTSSPTAINQPTSSISAAITSAKKTLSPSPAAPIKSIILDSTPDLDGFRSSNNAGNSALEIRAGRNANLVTRGFVSFDLSEIPLGAKITEATLKLYLASSVGKPFDSGGQLKIDHLTYGDSLDSSDYGLAALSSSFATLAGTVKKEWKEAEVANYVKDDFANARSRSQFRIHFQNENTGGDVAGDFVYFEAADNSTGSGNTPQLIVKYH